MRSYVMIILLSTFFGCKNDYILLNRPTDDHDFFPLLPNVVRTYDVLEINYLPDGNDTLRYLLRERIIDSLPEQNGVKTYLMLREKKWENESTFSADSIWTVQLNDRWLSVTENGNVRIKMVFPVIVGTEWDGHRLSTAGRAVYRFSSVRQADLQGDYEFFDISDINLIKTIIADIPPNIVLQNQQYEVYARQIGLVEKEIKVLNFCTVNCGEFGEIFGGRYLLQRLIAYDKN